MLAPDMVALGKYSSNDVHLPAPGTRLIEMHSNKTSMKQSSDKNRNN